MHTSQPTLLLLASICATTFAYLPPHPMTLRSKENLGMSGSCSLKCPGFTFAKKVSGSRGARQATSMMLAGAEFDTSVSGLLLAEEFFGQVAAGGIMIIASGIIGAFVVGMTADLDSLEENFRANNEANAQAGQGKRIEEVELNRVEKLPGDVEAELRDGVAKPSNE